MKKKVIVVVVVLLVIALGIVFYINTPVQRLQRQLELAKHYLEDMDYDEAIAAFEAAIDVEPKNEEAYIGLADAYIAINESDKAIEILQTGYEQTSSTDIQNKLEELTVQVENEVESEEQSETRAEVETEQTEEASEETESESDVLEVVAFEEREEYQKFETLESVIQDIVKALAENTFENLDDIDVVEKMVSESEIPWQSESALYKTKDYKILTQYSDLKISFECQLDERNEKIDLSAEVRPENGNGFFIDWSGYISEENGKPYKNLWICNCTDWQFNGDCIRYYDDWDEKSLEEEIYTRNLQVENNIVIGKSDSDYIWVVGRRIKEKNLDDVYW